MEATLTDSISIMQRVIDKYHNQPKWDNAPFGKVKVLSNTHIGDVGQEFVQEWCAALGMEWEDSPIRQGPWDAKIEGVTFEVKTATEDLTTAYQFNHIRHHREYQALLCIGIAPDAVLFDAWRKGAVSEGKAGHLVTMDRGSSATFKLTKRRAELRAIDTFKEHIESVILSIYEG